MVLGWSKIEWAVEEGSDSKMNNRDGSMLRLRTNDTSYSDLVLVNGPGALVYVSGQLAFNEARQIVGETVRDQVGICFDRIQALLTQVGGDLTDVIRITTYLADLEGYPDFDVVRAARFGEHRPASTAVGVAGLLFGALVEIEAIAFIPGTDLRGREQGPSLSPSK